MVRFNTEARATGHEGSAVQRALAGVIRPVTYTSLALVLSFLVLTDLNRRRPGQADRYHCHSPGGITGKNWIVGYFSIATC